jgi:hypothetical protein
VLPRLPCAHIPPPLPRWNRWVFPSLTSPAITAFPVLWPGRLPHQPFRGLHGVRFSLRSACSPSHLRDPLHRRRRPLRFLHDRSDYYRLERKFAGWDCPPTGESRLSTAHHNYGTANLSEPRLWPQSGPTLVAPLSPPPKPDSNGSEMTGLKQTFAACNSIDHCGLTGSPIFLRLENTGAVGKRSIQPQEVARIIQRIGRLLNAQHPGQIATGSLSRLFYLRSNRLRYELEHHEDRLVFLLPVSDKDLYHMPRCFEGPSVWSLYL